MEDSAPAPTVQKVKKTAKPKKPVEHPKYSEMVVAALKELKERGGSSKIKILKYIVSNYKVGDEKTVNTHLKSALKNAVKSGILKQTKGTGASGSFKLGEAVKKAPAQPKKPATKKPAAKKPTAKKTTTKMTKSPKKVVKQAAAKKPTAKKTTTKKSPKKVVKKAVDKKPKTPTKKVVKKTATKKPVTKKPATSPKKITKKPAAKKTKA